MAWLLVYLLAFLYHRLILFSLLHCIAETVGHGGSVRGWGPI